MCKSRANLIFQVLPNYFDFCGHLLLSDVKKRRSYAQTVHQN